MGVPTVTATRILKGQLGGKLGPETPLAMDQFPYLALSKTYNVDRQVPDSAGTATAYLCGVKANMKTIGVSAAARYNNCSTIRGNEVTSVMNRAKKAGKSVGVVTTTRVQHASPAGTYAHTVNRNWYSDTDMPAQAKKEGCQDIATQLIYNMDIDVILGGGRKYMFPEGTPDPEYPGDARQNGIRKDKRNLVQEWQAKHQGTQYVWNRTALIQASKDPGVTHLMGNDPAHPTVLPRDGCHWPSLLPDLPVPTGPFPAGLFEPADMKYEAQRDNSRDPSLQEMTEAALRVLSRNPRGFYLFVEGGRIDHGHHEGVAYRALTEAVVFDNAIAKAGQLTSEADTLILVTADHSHVFSFGGYTLRGSSIFGLGFGKANDSKSYTSILYGNGPGYALGGASRPDVDGSESSECRGGSVGGGTPAGNSREREAASPPALNPRPPVSGPRVPAAGGRAPGERDPRRRGRGGVRARPAGAPGARRAGADLRGARHGLRRLRGALHRLPPAASRRPRRRRAPGRLPALAGAAGRGAAAAAARAALTHTRPGPRGLLLQRREPRPRPHPSCHLGVPTTASHPGHHPRVPQPRVPHPALRQTFTAQR
eukprot:XP_028338501.1 intestinal-type alkaline phosphatase isoform X1 [Physeter catodon]